MKEKAIAGKTHLPRGLIIGAVAGFAGLYFYGAIAHANRVNLDVTLLDQSAYLSYARDLYETNYNYIGERNRMPLYPFLQSLIYDPTQTETAAFTRGKYFNIALSGVLLTGLSYIFKRCFSPLIAVNLLLITAFTVFMFKAGYFQTELLFYFLNFCCFLGMGWMLKHPSWWAGAGTGAIAGLAHLTKASILPGLVLFGFFFAAKTVYSLYASWRGGRSLGTVAKRQFFYQCLCLGLVFLSFLLTIYPYIHTSNQVFGQYFYNVNSTFYIWYDSWEEAKAGVRLYGGGRGWPDMPSDQIPSLQTYWREHSLWDILNRLWQGLDTLLSVSLSSYGYFKYAVIYLAIAVSATLLCWRQSVAVMRAHRCLIAFGISYFVVYLLLYAWYTPIASGERFPLAQFVPLMVSLTLVLDTLDRRCPVLVFGGRSIPWLSTFNFVMLGMILVELYPIFSYRILTMFAGT